MKQANPWVGVNYIADNASAPVPPPYFMQRIWDQDAMLVILPSRKTPNAYVIARRKQFGPGLTEAAIDAQYANPDTKMCVLNGCVPVCLMYRNGQGWDIDHVIATLQARDSWTIGDNLPGTASRADKIADMLEAEEDAAAKKLKQEIRDDQWNRSGDAWRSYQHRTGQSTIHSKDYLPARKVPAQGTADDSNSSSSSTATGSVFVSE